MIKALLTSYVPKAMLKADLKPPSYADLAKLQWVKVILSACTEVSPLLVALVGLVIIT